ncbi:MAG: hypothetical protein ACOY46_14815 [Bacillota bacterium]
MKEDKKIFKMPMTGKTPEKEKKEPHVVKEPPYRDYPIDPDLPPRG